MEKSKMKLGMRIGRQAIILMTGFLPINAGAQSRCADVFTTAVSLPRNPEVWLMKANPQKIRGVALPNGIVLTNTEGFQRNGFSADAFVLTEYFFEKASIQVPANAQKINLSTYQYYNPERSDYGLTLHRDRLLRGGGRDHALPLNPNQAHATFKGSTTEKGSGINEIYSKVNGAFSAKNYRTNGLQNDLEVASEITVIRQLERGGVPVVAHPQTRLAPFEFQQAIGAIDVDGKIVRPLAAQSTREQLTPRDSFEGVEAVTEEARYKLVASILLNNVGHGGINPENMATGKLNDPGHVTIGYPILSGTYRCVLCKNMDGSKWDGTMVGIMDYYFPGKEIKNYDEYFSRFAGELKSTKFTFNARIGEGIANEINRSFYGLAGSESLSATELTSFEALLRQKIQLNLFQIRQGHEMFYRIAEQLLNQPSAVRDVFYRFADDAISARFLMQLGALRAITGTQKRAEVDLFINRWRQRLTDPSKKYFDHMIKLFQRKFKSSPHQSVVLEKLFSEQKPLDMIIEDINRARRKKPGFEKWGQDLKNIIEADSRPVVWEPLEWMQTVNKVMDKYVIENEPAPARKKTGTL